MDDGIPGSLERSGQTRVVEFGFLREQALGAHGFRSSTGSRSGPMYVLEAWVMVGTSYTRSFRGGW